MSAKTWDLVFYVADDRTSSADYGPILIQVMTRKDVRMVHEPLLNRLPKQEGFGDLVAAEMVEKHPELTACKSSPSLYFLTAEDMGVDIIHYDWYISSGHWYQVINPYALDTLKPAN